MIQSYEFGSIVIDGKSFNSDVLVFPDSVDGNWWRIEGHKLHAEDIERVVQSHPEVLVVGSGFYGMMTVLPEAKDYARLHGIELIVEPTGQAAKTFNEVSKTRRAVAALHLTC